MQACVCVCICVYVSVEMSRAGTKTSKQIPELSHKASDVEGAEVGHL